jgi:hypothetical protein
MRWSSGVSAPAGCWAGLGSNSGSDPYWADSNEEMEMGSGDCSRLYVWLYQCTYSIVQEKINVKRVTWSQKNFNLLTNLLTVTNESKNSFCVNYIHVSTNLYKTFSLKGWPEEYGNSFNKNKIEVYTFCHRGKLTNLYHPHREKKDRERRKGR